MKRYYLVAILLFLAVFFEVRAQTYWIYTNEKHFASWVYVIGGFLVGVLPLIKLPSLPAASYLTPRQLQPYTVPIKLLIWGVFIVLGVQACNQIFPNYELHYRWADMLPVIRIMSERFLEGEEVYAYIPDIWDGMEPVYLPTMWLPFVPSVAWDFDMRWTTFFFIVAGGMMVSVHPAWSTFKKHSFWSILAFIPLGCLFFIDIFAVGDHLRGLTMGLSEEGVVFGFHLLLVFALVYRKMWLLAVALSCCVLSRYVIVIWATMYMVHLFLSAERKKALQIIGVGAVLCTFLMWITGAFDQLDVFIGLQGEYVDLLEKKRWDYSKLINRALGFGKFFAYEDLTIMHQLFLACTFAVPFVCLLLVRLLRKWVNMGFFALCSLKITLVFFYNLLIIPYEYLFYTSTFISVGILFCYLSPALHPKSDLATE
ncbi:MAG: hypothetical protein MK212_04680 [Saprospiraceae bacterium]|nr:hypothetical protein [Saprospiraceae bacterium]